jgi:type II secretory pathway pseudopilin PulG
LRGGRGFSLVATILMLTLLMVLALAMTTLSAVTVRTAGNDREVQRARANARLALQMAIGELQALAGQDQRVTAPSTGGGKDARPHLTGVWEGWRWDGSGSAPDWEREKKSRFKGWLISSAERGAARDVDFVNAPAAGRVVRLAPPAISGKGVVEAGVVEIADPSRKRGRKDGYAWAVFDQSQKTDFSLPTEDEDNGAFARGLDRMSAALEPGYEAVKTFDWKPLSVRRDERRHVTSLGQSRLVGIGKDDASFHDAAAGTFGLLTDSVNGGWKKDLSQLFKDDVLPASHARRFLYSGSDTPLLPPPTRFEGANPFPSPDPSWALLHSHYRSYRDLSGGAKPSHAVTTASVVDRPDSAAITSSEQLLRQPAFNGQQIAPVIAKAQFVFSLAFGVNQKTLNAMWANGSARSTPASQRDNYITWMVIDPVITLWNPYNVPLQFSGATIELYRVPMAFRLYKNGARLAENYTRLTDAHTQNDFRSRQNRFYLLKLLPEKGQSNRVMEPGEHVVFTGHEWTLHGSHRYNQQGLTMRPGFNPPAGASSSKEIGGVTTQNLFVSPTGASTGRDYGKTIRTVAVKGGDKIQVEVKPERAGADELTETGKREVTGFLKYYVGIGTRAQRRFIGGIELDYGEKEKEYLPEFGRNELPAIVVDSSIPKTAPGNTNVDPDEAGADDALRWKEPFLIASFQQKTERDSKFPSRSWINNSPGNLYAAGGLDQTEDFAHHQYEFKWEPMTDWPPDSPTIELSNDGNRGYGGSGVYSQSGTEFASFTSLPVEPALSLGQFTHAPLNAGGQLPLVAHPFGNSFAPALIPADRITESVGSRTYLDHSYFANNALLDSHFLSGAVDHPARFGSPALRRDTLLGEFLAGRDQLPNLRFSPYTGLEAPSVVTERILSDTESHDHIAANLLVKGAFNVNSKSVAAWQALLASNFNGSVPLVGGDVADGDGVPVSRNVPSVGGNNTSEGGGTSDREKWSGHRRLSAEQIESLAEALVEQVEKRGPFLSLAEFVNRQPGEDTELSAAGAVQSAIDASGINEGIIDRSFDFNVATGANPAAGSGNTADGAPGLITQADILTPLLPQLTVRGDTFVIRTCGEAVDVHGRIVRAWCEATVQRYPDHVDSRDATSQVASTEVNKKFGRRISIVSFRWLTPSEI